ncbi:hypothetical protein VAE122_3060266 [Vibrio aestuarianus]|nr:hypothetical protein VAE122_3060266 [Vibrio aestuarianus]
MPTFHSNLTFDVSIQAVQAAVRSLGMLVTHRLFVKDDISHGMLVELGEPVANPHQDFYFVCPKNKLKQESVLKLRAWLRREFTCSETTLSDDIAHFGSESEGGYIKLLFTDHGDTNIASISPQQRPVMRTYTIQHFNAENNSIEVDFVRHITKDLQCGFAARWA